MLLGTLVASVLGNILIWERVTRAGISYNMDL